MDTHTIHGTNGIFAYMNGSCVWDQCSYITVRPMNPSMGYIYHCFQKLLTLDIQANTSSDLVFFFDTFWGCLVILLMAEIPNNHQG